MNIAVCTLVRVDCKPEDNGLTRRTPMITLLIAVSALFVAVIGSALLDPWPPSTVLQPADQTDEDYAQMMEGMAHSSF